MKALLLTLCLVLLVSCSDQVPRATAPQEYPKIQMTSPAPQPNLVFAVGPARVTLAQDHFLLVRRSIQTPQGTETILPGAQVQKAADGKYIYRGNLLLLSPDEVTTNAGVAAAARVRCNTPTPAATPVSVPSPTSLDRGAYDLRRRVARPPIFK